MFLVQISEHPKEEPTLRLEEYASRGWLDNGTKVLNVLNFNNGIPSRLKVHTMCGIVGRMSAIETPKLEKSEQKHSQRCILLIEDNEADATLMKVVHDQVKHCSWLQIVDSGAEALRYLRREGEYADRVKPDLILMDLSLPMKSGLDLIADLRAIPGCELIPIIIVSGTENPMTLRQAYQFGANCMIKKPVNWDEYYKKLESCYEFWCSVAELPH